MFNVFRLYVDDEPPREQGGGEPEGEVWLLIQLVFSMYSVERGGGEENFEEGSRVMSLKQT